MESYPCPPGASASPYSHPERLCDLVMKGGITSGVVYPPAVVALAERFRFRNIGGTSAGAIAAAAAAAAEFGRDRGGFEQLAKLSSFLGKKNPATGQTHLFEFFQPQVRTRRLFKVVSAALGGGWQAALSVVATAVGQFPVEALLGAVPGLLLLYGGLSGAQGVLVWVCLGTGALLLALGTLIALSLALAQYAGNRLPENFYGLCTGMPTSDSLKDRRNTSTAADTDDGKSLTVWLTDYLDRLAGLGQRDHPLTFGDLWGKRDELGDRVINLEMMTTCLTHGRPYRLPFRNDADIHENSFYFSPAEFRRLFPRRVVDWMEAHPREASDQKRRDRLRDQGLLPLPEPKDLPVVVAVRMSLSFPILLSAVPLYALNWRTRKGNGGDDGGTEVPEHCWFSDGGISSNFPLHFFDSPLPRWPTLSINLVEKPKGTCVELLREPSIAKSNNDKIQEQWDFFEDEQTARNDGTTHANEKGGIRKLFGFVNAILTTMQNWSDNTQARLPGYRDRIAHVGLVPEEGGMNLNMPDERIEELGKRGKAVAEVFIRRFAATPASQDTDPRVDDPSEFTVNDLKDCGGLAAALTQPADGPARFLVGRLSERCKAALGTWQPNTSDKPPWRSVFVTELNEIIADEANWDDQAFSVSKLRASTKALLDSLPTGRDRLRLNRLLLEDAWPTLIQRNRMDWENHRWLRMRSFLACFENTLRKVDQACTWNGPGDLSYPNWLADTATRRGTSYSWKGDKQRVLAGRTLASLRSITKDWHDGRISASTGAPRPRPELRVRPQI